MALIPIKIERTRRPPAGTPLRRDGHWSVRDLYSAFAFNEGAGAPINLVDGAIGTLSGATWNPYGLRNGTISQYALANQPMLNPPGDNWSIFTVIDKDDNTTTPFPLSPSIGDANLTSAVYLRSGIWFGWVTTAYSQIRWTSAAAIDQIGKNSWCIVRNGSGQNHVLYKNGTSLGAPSAYPADLSQTWTNFKCLGSRYNSAGLIMETALFYHRSLLPSEISSLSANPWQIFEPELLWINTGSSANLNAYFLIGGTPKKATAAYVLIGGVVKPITNLKTLIGGVVKSI